MTSPRRGMQGCVDGPERSNGDAHDAHSLVGGAHDIEPAERRSGRVRRRGLRRVRRRARWTAVGSDGDQSRPRLQADSRAAGRERPPDGGAGRGGDRPIRSDLWTGRCDEPAAVEAPRRPGRSRRGRGGGPVDPERAGGRHGLSLVAQWGIRRERPGPSRTLPSRRRGVGGLAAHHRRPVSRRGLGAPPPQRPPARRRSEGPFGPMGPRLHPDHPSRLGDGCGTGRCHDRCRADIRTLPANR